jgi:hypothetical protein
MKKIKIVSQFSHKGGSTIALINLCNKFNEIGYDCTFYGPHQWHLDKCNGDSISNLSLKPSDVLICHYIVFKERPNVKKVILSCHEKNLFEVGFIKQFWDEVVFLNQKHKDYHWLYMGKYHLIPNLKQNLIYREKKELDMIAGIIGTFDPNKQVDVSIQRALSDGCEKIYLFGDPNSHPNFESKIKPLLSDKVVLKGFLENKQEMYDMIGRVYHSSLSEVATLVKDECELTGTKFFGNEATNYEPIVMTNDEIINKWIEILKK